MWLVPLAESTAACGGKAVALARLIAAGLPVPEGWVLDDRAFRAAAGALAPGPGPGAAAPGLDELGHTLAAAAARIEEAELPPELVAEVAARAAELGRLAVRSSATIEDGAAGAAAGVFSSRVAVPPGEVWPAVRAVWASALTPLAVSYARLRDGAAGVGAGGIAIAAILQRHVDGERATIYTRPPGAPEGGEVWIQRGDRLEKRPRGDADPLAQLALAAERAIGAPRGADVEVVIAGDGRAWIVQARPIVHPARRAQVPPPPVVLAPLVADGRRWTWDAAHNPDPLSVAQAALVERVERAGVAPWSMRVCAGYLYTAPREELPRPALGSRAELDARVRALEARIEAVLAPAEADPEAGAELTLDDALARYLAFYALWAREVVPLIAAARARAPAGSLRGARPSSIEAALLAAARGELAEAAVVARFAAMSPAWDVAVPTFGERPAVLRDAIARARLLGERAPVPPPPAEDDLARAGADLAERDDLWFARAQWLVRRALLRAAAALGLPAEDAFWLPPEELAAAATAAATATATAAAAAATAAAIVPSAAAGAADSRTALAPADVAAAPAAPPTALSIDDARRRAAAARAAAARAARWSMPFVVASEAAPAPSAPLRGAGTGGRVTGRVKKVISLATSIAVSRADVVVTRAVTPALAVFVTGCAALVSETGGLLDHGASLARELGIPCVVGCRDAWSLLEDGAIVTVDGDAGIVVADGS
ncbi:MAG TPA: PEP/pyruvate-binding domain-containing protein [Kofleriaceae bacterium]|nr:PEP/pyruvate-binding domain-containing protein [Kofleriaceae bacterium]